MSLKEPRLANFNSRNVFSITPVYYPIPVGMSNILFINYPEVSTSGILKLLESYGFTSYEDILINPPYAMAVLSRWLEHAYTEYQKVHGTLPELGQVNISFNYMDGYTVNVVESCKDILTYLHADYWSDVREYTASDIAWLADYIYVFSGDVIKKVINRYGGRNNMWDTVDKQLVKLVTLLKDGPDEPMYDVIEKGEHDE